MDEKVSMGKNLSSVNLSVHGRQRVSPAELGEEDDEGVGREGHDPDEDAADGHLGDAQLRPLALDDEECV